MRRDLPGPVLDKHSTGGVGDTVSLMLAPLVAACGGFVPMISGPRPRPHRRHVRQDGVDPRLRSDADVDGSAGRQGGRLRDHRPDRRPGAGRRRLYAIRDVTATVESIPLITASILSKKLAAGLDALVMDVKVGSGRVHARRCDDARELAASIVGVAAGAGLPTVALLTDMDQPLASAAGNALEVAYADRLPHRGAARAPLPRGRRRARRRRCWCSAASPMTRPTARAQFQQALDSGAPRSASPPWSARSAARRRCSRGRGTHLERAPVVVRGRRATAAASSRRIDTRRRRPRRRGPRRRPRAAARPGRPRRRAHRRWPPSAPPSGRASARGRARPHRRGRAAAPRPRSPRRTRSATKPP